MIKISQEQLKDEGAVCCAVCGLYAHNISTHIIRIHGIKSAEYKMIYNLPVMSKKILEDKKCVEFLMS